MSSLGYYFFVLISRMSYGGIHSPSLDEKWCFRELVHPGYGTSLLVVRMGKVEGQTVDLEIHCSMGLLPRIEREYYYYNNFPPLKDVYIAIDNKLEGFYFPCLTVKPKPGKLPENFEFHIRIIRDQHEVNQIINKIFDAGANR